MKMKKPRNPKNAKHVKALSNKANKRLQIKELTSEEMYRKIKRNEIDFTDFDSWLDCKFYERLDAYFSKNSLIISSVYA